MDTFPRATPFETKHKSGKLLWFTVSSQRRAGLRMFFPNPSVVGDPATNRSCRARRPLPPPPPPPPPVPR